MKVSQEHHNAYRKQRYRDDPEYAQQCRDAAKKRKKKHVPEIDKLVASWKSEGCQACGEAALCCLDAHHPDPKSKSFGISQARVRGLSLTRIKAELAKCICVCKNCHAKIHAGLLAL